MTWVTDNLDLVAELTGRHLTMALPSILASLLIAIPLGRLAHAHRALRGLVLAGSGALYALPSLPLFVILPSILGTRILDPLNVVVALTLYGVALLVRSATEAFDAVPRDVRQAALAMGHSRWQQFARVELPLAGPPILAGLRVVSASTLSLVSVGALIGVRSLGSLFTEGYARSFLLEIGVGIVATVALAVAVDLALVGLGRLAMPWLTRRSRRGIA